MVQLRLLPDATQSKRLLETMERSNKQRAALHNWAFAQLRAFLTYKAALAGVLLITIDPRNTSRECSACGSIDKRNRIDQSSFRCLACGHAENADTNASRVIAGRATRKLAEGDRAQPSDRAALSHG